MVIAKAKACMRATANATDALWKLALPTHRREVVSSSLSNLPAALRTRNQKAHVVMVFAQPLYCGRNSTNSALLERESAFLAKMLAVICCVATSPNALAAFFTGIRKQNSLSGGTAVVMKNAESPSKVRLSAQLTERPWAMDKVVFALVPAQFEVFNPIVMPNLIDVMNFLLAPKKPSDVLLHDQPMLPNISPLVAMGMIRELDSDIAVLILILLSRLSIRCFSHKRKDFTCPS